jgi:hypothetical protein
LIFSSNSGFLFAKVFIEDHSIVINSTLSKAIAEAILFELSQKRAISQIIHQTETFHKTCFSQFKIFDTSIFQDLTIYIAFASCNSEKSFSQEYRFFF